MDSKPHCATCGKDVAEVQCPECGKWWADNQPVPASSDLVERVAEAIYRQAKMNIGADANEFPWYEATVQSKERNRATARAIIPIIQADERERANPFEGTTFETRDERTEREAEQLYRKSTANDPVIHCNRFPVWEELREESRQEWRDRAIRERNGG